MAATNQECSSKALVQSWREFTGPAQSQPRAAEPAAATLL
jgi:hypothetical protein